jgi:hypothetical protein
MTEALQETPPAEEECVLCGRVLAGLGIFLGVFFLYVAVDVLTQGKLTQRLGLGGVVPVEEVE